MKRNVRQTTASGNAISEAHAQNALKTYYHYTNLIAEMEDDLDDDINYLKSIYNEKIKQWEGEKEKAFEVIHAYAVKNPRLFEKKKSIDWQYGSFGFRTGMPKLKISKGFELTEVMSLLKKENASYIRITEELNKDMIISDRQRLNDKINSLGIEIVQDEKFFVKSKDIDLIS